MKRIECILLLIVLLTVASANAQQNVKVYYVQLKEGQKIESSPVKQIVGNSETKGKLVRLYPEMTFQTIEGFGGAFNEIGGEALMSLGRDQRTKIMKNLFAINGANFTLCRTAIGSSDFGIDAYSYSEVPEDYKMNEFSIKREKNSVIPFIQAAYKYNPKMILFASPWSPPGWMKESGFMDKGKKYPSKNRLKDEPKVYESYALYLSKYVQTYAKEGIKVDRVVIQNEQDITTGYPSCHMPPKQMGEFIINYMRPQFQSDGLETEIWAGTFRTAKRLDGLEFVSNKRWREAIDGIGIQYTESRQIEDLRVTSPHTNLLHTEGVCFRGTNSVTEAFSRFEEIASYVNYGVPNYCYWNMILNETGKSGWGWKQNCLINIDRESKTVTYNPDYAVMTLFSKFMRPGMKRIAVSNWKEETLALADKKNVYLFLKNETQNTKAYDVWIKDKQAEVVDIPAQSLSVIVVNYL